jgi:cell division protein ZapA
MAALQFVIKLLESENRFEVAPLVDELNELDEWLDDYLEKSDIRSLK